MATADAQLIGTVGKDAAVARRAATTAEATAAMARETAIAARAEAETARGIAEQFRREGEERDREHSSKLSSIQTEVARHGSELATIRSTSDRTKLWAKGIAAITALATAIGAYGAASKPSREEERKTVSAVVAQTVDGTRDQVRQYVAETVRELREDDKRKEEAAMVEVRRMLARIERDAAPVRDPGKGIARARRRVADVGGDAYPAQHLPAENDDEPP